VPAINGVIVFELPHKKIDERGDFTKILSLNVTPELNIEEVFLSKTKKGYIRGLHFQNGPYLNNRIISCLAGKVFDVLIDLRPESSTFQNISSIEMNSLSPIGMYVPSGVAHGFQSLENDSQMIYFSDKAYNSDFDAGVAPNNSGVEWPIRVVGMSERDASLPSLTEYLSRN
jgi:dTDP-4-dehydrorhamnose 3,5-epimerase